MWTLESGLKLVRALDNQAAEFGFHLALGGSVLRKGESTKDIDLYFLPYDNPKYPENLDGLINWLTKIWGKPTRISVEEYPTRPSYLDEDAPAAPQIRAERGPDGRVYVRPIRAAARYGAPEVPKSERYKDKLKFMRPDGQRIDVFIM